MAIVPDADLTGVYCRKSQIGDKQQITVNRQKRLALQDCEKLGLVVKSGNVFIDNGVPHGSVTGKGQDGTRYWPPRGVARSSTSCAITPTVSCGSRGT
jgi:hypothetical protein